MILPDANLLIYAYAPSDPDHKKSRVWLEDILSGLAPVGIPMLSIYAFLRVVTDPKGINALSFQRAAEIVDSWLEPAHVRILYPGDQHWFILCDLADQVRLAGRQITDAAIAAIALEYGATVYSNDPHFARFPNVRWINPLKP